MRFFSLIPESVFYLDCVLVSGYLAPQDIFHPQSRSHSPLVLALKYLARGAKFRICIYRARGAKYPVGVQNILKIICTGMPYILGYMLLGAQKWGSQIPCDTGTAHFVNFAIYSHVYAYDLVAMSLLTLRSSHCPDVADKPHQP